jgi:hypothetical protein
MRGQTVESTQDITNVHTFRTKGEGTTHRSQTPNNLHSSVMSHVSSSNAASFLITKPVQVKSLVEKALVINEVNPEALPKNFYISSRKAERSTEKMRDGFLFNNFYHSDFQQQFETKQGVSHYKNLQNLEDTEAENDDKSIQPGQIQIMHNSGHDNNYKKPKNVVEFLQAA